MRVCLRAHARACVCVWYLGVSVCVCVCVLQGLDRPAQRLREWHFPTPLTLTLHHYLTTTDALTTLHTLVPGLHELQAPAVTLRLYTMTWTAELSQAATNALSLSPHIHIQLSIDNALTDALLRALLPMGAALRKLAVSKLGLQSGEHVGAGWPWEDLCVERVHAAGLLRLPQPNGTPILQCQDFVLGAVKEVGASLLWHMSICLCVGDSQISYGFLSVK